MRRPAPRTIRSEARSTSPMLSADGSVSRTSLADRYRLLLEIGRTLTGTLGRDELFRTIYQQTSRVLETGGFYVSLYDPAVDRATVVFYADRGAERHVEITYPGSESEVIQTGRPSIFDAEDDMESLLVLGDEEDEVTRSAISAPLRYQDRVIGAVSAQSYRSGAYSEEDLELLQGIADMAAVAVVNARRVSQVERRRMQAEQIEEIGRAVVSSLEPRRVLRKVIDAALELVDADGASVWFLEDERTVRVEASGGEIALDEDLSSEVDPELWTPLLEERSPVLIDDLESSPLIPDSLREHLRAGTGLAVPLVVEDRVLGALTVGSRRARAFTEDDLRVMEQLASQASVALENARLHSDVQELSLTDPLTGLPNRRHLAMHMEREVAAARRGRDLAAVIFDLDNFKQYNDTLGHQAGDEILRAFARILDDEARSMNLVARYGGDEFVSVLSDTSADGARIHAERVARRVQTDPELEPHGITVSYGLATFDSQMSGPSQLVHAADEDLYRTKADRPEAAGDESPGT